MKLTNVKIKYYRNIINSTDVSIQDDITCFVGKNESGKTAFLYGLYLLNPIYAHDKFNLHYDYPAWLIKKHRSGKDLEEHYPVEAVYELEKSDRDVIEEKFGKDTFVSDKITLKRNYKGKLMYLFNTNEEKAIAHIVKTSNLPGGYIKAPKAAKSFEELYSVITEFRAKEGEETTVAYEAADSLESQIREVIGDQEFRESVRVFIDLLIPKFFYTGSYDTLPYSTDIHRILETNNDDLNDKELTAKSFLRIGGTEEDYLMNPDYELRKRELESVANILTSDVLNYWTQNDKLRVLPDLTQKTIAEQDGKHTVLDELKIRIWDDRHRLSLPIDQHSTGFQWFVSFLARYYEYEHADPPVIILLDEPALGLHARAQKDFLRFIEEKLGVKCQVLYTTHSPFMIQPDHLDKIRLVEDKSIDEGAVISSDILSTDPDTLFPLQGALGYDMAQHLFIGPNNLVIEGTSDFTYLSVISDHNKELEKTSLDDAWSLVPVGGADLIPTFVALLGHHLDVTVMIDSRTEGNQKLSRLADKGYLSKKRLIPLGQIIGKNLADIEDLFTVDDYLMLYNDAFNDSVKPSDLSGDDSIVNQIARHKNIKRFNHGKPADIFLRKRDVYLPKLSDQTLENFEKLFKALNKTKGK